LLARECVLHTSSNKNPAQGRAHSIAWPSHSRRRRYGRSWGSFAVAGFRVRPHEIHDGDANQPSIRDCATVEDSLVILFSVGWLVAIADHVQTIAFVIVGNFQVGLHRLGGLW